MGGGGTPLPERVVMSETKYPVSRLASADDDEPDCDDIEIIYVFPVMEIIEQTPMSVGLIMILGDLE